MARGRRRGASHTQSSRDHRGCAFRRLCFGGSVRQRGQCTRSRCISLAALTVHSVQHSTRGTSRGSAPVVAARSLHHQAGAAAKAQLAAPLGGRVRRRRAPVTALPIVLGTALHNHPPGLPLAGGRPGWREDRRSAPPWLTGLAALGTVAVGRAPVVAVPPPVRALQHPAPAQSVRTAGACTRAPPPAVVGGATGLCWWGRRRARSTAALLHALPPK
eukprot:gene7153-biopygen4519